MIHPYTFNILSCTTLWNHKSSNNLLLSKKKNAVNINFTVVVYFLIIRPLLKNELTERTRTVLPLCAECMKPFYTRPSSQIIHRACYNHGAEMCPDWGCGDLWSPNKMAFIPSKSHTLTDTVIHNKTTRSSLKIRTNYIPSPPAPPPSVWQLTLCISLVRIQDYSQMWFASSLLPAGKSVCEGCWKRRWSSAVNASIRRFIIHFVDIPVPNRCLKFSM